MQVDFYHLTRDPVERVLPVLATRTLGLGERMLIVSAHTGHRATLSQALWTHTPESFLAHGDLDAPNPQVQPLLLADRVEPANGAGFIALADGIWRDEALSFARIFLLFSDTTIADARKAWVALGAREGLARHYWKQDGGKWVEQTPGKRQDADGPQ
ncbi:DNA polymerase III subunit chi [Blastomonas aquatica]|uniref:DNA polymerase III subunit chi n=1 Tax=Blastomonas aquatica TaxID=1510276 RepID=A0ABQ1J907_9SPHN|nr:DNA polymerase III subunit chi [Blastomonas aquatica]GGB61235.1 DNA polymerase III subunit chi [Blastomonas aquatica]